MGPARCWIVSIALTFVALTAAPHGVHGSRAQVWPRRTLHARRTLEEDAAASSGDVTAGPTLPSRCPGECTKHGTCNEELGRCDCPLGRNGTDCSQAVPDSAMRALCGSYGHTVPSCTRVDASACINGCSFRGRCVGGFCHCRPGFFGTDCSLSLAPAAATAPSTGGAAGAGAAAQLAARVEVLAGQNYSVRTSGPRIYVYELPPRVSVWHSLERLDRPLMYMLWQRILSAGLRTADPTEADFFFVPVRVRLLADSGRVLDAVSYISNAWPYWNATGGERHIFVHTGDWGRDELSNEAANATANSTWLTHWGLARDHDFAGWKRSHRPGRDIVLPLVLQHSLLAAYRLGRYGPLHPAGRRRERTRTLFFAGRVCGSRAAPTTNGTYPPCPDVLGKEDAYSAATRQRAFFHHHNRTNWKVVTHSRSYAADMMSSKFCLAPSGGGMGKRGIIAVLMGCIPVTVTDGLMQPFEPELRWDRFAIDVRERDIQIMHELLGGLRDTQVAEFQASLRCAAQHLFWSSLYGSLFGEDGRYDAFETLVQVLRMRAAYPNLAPEEYAYVDSAFAAFMKCDDSAGAGGSGASASAGAAADAVAGAVARSSNSSSSSGDGWLLDVAKPGLQALVRGGHGNRTALPVLRAPGSKQLLCSQSELPLEGVPPCNKCVRRRGRLLNPGGTICCNVRELAKCPRLWD